MLRTSQKHTSAMITSKKYLYTASSWRPVSPSGTRAPTPGMACSHSVIFSMGAHVGASRSLSIKSPLLPPVRSATFSSRMIDGNTAATANVNSPRYNPWMRSAGIPNSTPNTNSPGTTTPRVDR